MLVLRTIKDLIERIVYFVLVHRCFATLKSDRPDRSYLWARYTIPLMQRAHLAGKSAFCTLTRLQNSRFFCEPEHRGQYSNERSGESIETVRKAGESR